MREWRPIETAPRDGTPVLVYCREEVDRPGWEKPPEPAQRVAIAFVSHPNPDYPRAPAHWVSVDVHVDTFSGSSVTGAWNEYEWTTVHPTHWQPLPAPPEDRP